MIRESDRLVTFDRRGSLEEAILVGDRVDVDFRLKKNGGEC